MKRAVGITGGSPVAPAAIPALSVDDFMRFASSREARALLERLDLPQGASEPWRDTGRTRPAALQRALDEAVRTLVDAAPDVGPAAQRFLA